MLSIASKPISSKRLERRAAARAGRSRDQHQPRRRHCLVPRGHHVAPRSRFPRLWPSMYCRSPAAAACCRGCEYTAADSPSTSCQSGSGRRVARPRPAWPRPRPAQCAGRACRQAARRRAIRSARASAVGGVAISRPCATCKQVWSSLTRSAPKAINSNASVDLPHPDGPLKNHGARPAPPVRTRRCWHERHLRHAQSGKPTTNARPQRRAVGSASGRRIFSAQITP